jgi:Ca-activated chloride channel homolog
MSAFLFRECFFGNFMWASGMKRWRLLCIISGVLLSGLSGMGYAATPSLITTIDGESPIQLQRVVIAGDISGGMAQTKVRLVFFNPNSRPLRGDLQFPLLERQKVTAFALDIDGKLRPAVPVEKEKGRQIFEDIERRQIDPALLEMTQGNNFKLRIFPIPAKGTRMVELTYAESMERDGAKWLYRLPLEFGERVQDFDLSITVNGINTPPKATGSVGRLGIPKFVSIDDTYRTRIEKTNFFT